jgi:histidinol dehydrogenase
LSANDFQRRCSVLHFSREGLADMAADVRLLSEREGLTAHSASVDLRLAEQTSQAPRQTTPDLIAPRSK